MATQVSIKPKSKVICIDDEEFILEALQRTLRRQFQVFTATSAHDAYDIIKSEDEIAVAIVDQRMPEVSGVEVLEYLTKNHPDIVKIVLTGYTDMTALVDSINKGEVFRYINKPWEPDALRQAIGEAIGRFDKINKSTLLEAQLLNTRKELKRCLEGAGKP